MTGPRDPPPPRGRASTASQPPHTSTASATAAAAAAAVTAEPLPLRHKQTPTPAPPGMQSIHAASDVLAPPLICPVTTRVLGRMPPTDATPPPPPAPPALGHPPVGADGGVGKLALAGATVGARRSRGGVELAGAGAAVTVDARNGAVHSTAAAWLLLHVGTDELPRGNHVEGGAGEDRLCDAVPRLGPALKVDATARRQQKPPVPVGKNLKHRA